MEVDLLDEGVLFVLGLGQGEDGRDVVLQHLQDAHLLDHLVELVQDVEEGEVVLVGLD